MVKQYLKEHKEGVHHLVWRIADSQEALLKPGRSWKKISPV
jgi:hypothetical protein